MKKELLLKLTEKEKQNINKMPISQIKSFFEKEELVYKNVTNGKTKFYKRNKLVAKIDAFFEHEKLKKEAPQKNIIDNVEDKQIKTLLKYAKFCYPLTLGLEQVRKDVQWLENQKIDNKNVEEIYLDIYNNAVLNKLEIMDSNPQNAQLFYKISTIATTAKEKEKQNIKNSKKEENKTKKDNIFKGLA